MARQGEAFGALSVAAPPTHHRKLHGVMLFFSSCKECRSVPPGLVMGYHPKLPPSRGIIRRPLPTRAVPQPARRLHGVAALVFALQCFARVMG